MQFRVDPTFEIARRLNLESVSIKVFDWGKFTGTTEYLRFEEAIAGLAIGPGSAVDRVILQAPPVVNNPDLKYIIVDTFVSVEQPYVGDILAPWEVRPLGVSIYTGKMVPYDDEKPINAGTSAFLSLRAFLRPPSILFTRRCPAAQPSKFVPMDAGENILYSYCVAGRRHIRVWVKTLGSGQASFLVTGSPGEALPSNYYSGTAIYEVPLTDRKTIDVPEQYTFDIENPNMYWLFVRGKLENGNPAARIDMQAID